CTAILLRTAPFLRALRRPRSWSARARALSIESQLRTHSRLFLSGKRADAARRPTIGGGVPAIRGQCRKVLQKHAKTVHSGQSAGPLTARPGPGTGGDRGPDPERARPPGPGRAAVHPRLSGNLAA